jgi:Rieske [2Fe-2S] domain
MPGFLEVANTPQIPEGGAIGVEVEGKRLALVNLKGEVYGLDDTCPHEAGPLSEGQIVGEDIQSVSAIAVAAWPCGPPQLPARLGGLTVTGPCAAVGRAAGSTGTANSTATREPLGEAA